MTKLIKPPMLTLPDLRLRQVPQLNGLSSIWREPVEQRST
jgi:hypothetical protein